MVHSRLCSLFDISMCALLYVCVARTRIVHIERSQYMARAQPTLECDDSEHRVEEENYPVVSDGTAKF